MSADASSPGARPYFLRIDDERCQLCSACQAMRVCRGRAMIRFAKEEAPIIDAGRCLLCLACVAKCPYAAIARVGAPEST